MKYLTTLLRPSVEHMALHITLYILVSTFFIFFSNLQRTSAHRAPELRAEGRTRPTPQIYRDA